MTSTGQLNARVLPRDRRTIVKRLHLLDRQGEWWSAVFMVACGLALCLPGDPFAYPTWIAFKGHGMSKALWTCLFSGCGSARIVALIVNGYMQLVTPIVRWAASFIGLMMWIGCIWLVFDGTPEHDRVVTLALPLYIVLAVKEATNIYLTAIDVRIQP